MDTGKDGVPDWSDLDADNYDGTPRVEQDCVKDGVPDVDNDGISDGLDNDDDNDGIPDPVDDDDDNDGIPDEFDEVKNCNGIHDSKTTLSVESRTVKHSPAKVVLITMLLSLPPLGQSF